jgi:hypothetical protein
VDPNSTLDAIYAAVDALAHAVNTGSRGATMDALCRLAVSSTELDEWLTRGGFMPDPPAPFVLTDLARDVLAG